LTPAVRDRVHEYLGGVIRKLDGCLSLCVGGVADHIHMAVSLHSTHSLADVMRELKSQSSRWIREEFNLPKFAWQEGYGAFTFSSQDIETVRHYIKNQEEHHRVKTFQEEYVAMLKRAGVDYEERYLW